MNIRNVIKSHKTIYRLARWCVGRPLNRRYIYSWDDVSFMATEWSRLLPRGVFDCVVGVPRGGLIVADVVALELGLPLCTPEGFVRGEFWLSKALEFPKVCRRVLVVDESVGNGTSMVPVLERLRGFAPFVEFCSAALVKSEGGFMPDFWYVCDRTFANRADVRKYVDVVNWDYV